MCNGSPGRWRVSLPWHQLYIRAFSPPLHKELSVTHGFGGGEASSSSEAAACVCEV